MKSRLLPKIVVEEYLDAIGYYSNASMTIEQAVLKLACKHTDYTCLRPPGAAGAIFVSVQQGRMTLGCVEPPVGHTCKEAGECEMENGHCVRTIHGEVNALLVAAKYGIPTNHGTIYSILKPCYQCTKAIIAAGIEHIYYAGAAYDEGRTRKLIEEADIECAHIDIGLEYGNG